MLLSRSLKLAVLGFALIAGGCDRESRETAQPQAADGAAAGSKPAGTFDRSHFDRSHRGTQLPDFVLSDTLGNKIRLADFRGKPLLLNLWATWCAPCVVELPMLDRLAGSKAGALKVLTVSQDTGQPEKVAAFLKDRGIRQLEPWLDPENNLSFHYATGTLPTTVLYDAQGREVWRFVGGHDWTGGDTAAMLAEGLE